MRSRCWRAFLLDELKRFTKDPAHEVRFVRKAYRIVFLLPHSKALSPTKPSSKEEIRSVLAGWALRDNGGLRAVVWRTVRLSFSRSSHDSHAFRGFSDATGGFGCGAHRRASSHGADTFGPTRTATTLSRNMRTAGSSSTRTRSVVWKRKERSWVRYMSTPIGLSVACAPRHFSTVPPPASAPTCKRKIMVTNIFLVACGAQGIVCLREAGNHWKVPRPMTLLNASNDLPRCKIGCSLLGHNLRSSVGSVSSGVFFFFKKVKKIFFSHIAFVFPVRFSTAAAKSLLPTVTPIAVSGRA